MSFNLNVDGDPRGIPSPIWSTRNHGSAVPGHADAESRARRKRAARSAELSGIHLRMGNQLELRVGFPSHVMVTWQLWHHRSLANEEEQLMPAQELWTDCLMFNARSSGFTESVTPAKLAVMMGRCWKNEGLAGCFSSPHTDRWKRGNRKTLRPLTGVLKLVHCLKVTWDAKLVWHIKLAPPFSPHDTSHLEVS